MKKTLNKRFSSLKKININSLTELFIGFDNKTSKNVFIKKLHVNSNEINDEFIVRFKNESTQASEISHPNILKLIQLIEKDNSLYLIMEYFEGKLLSESFKDFSFSEKINIILEIAKTLEFIHKNEIIHKDIKPQNFLINSNGKIDLKIFDFGSYNLINFENLHKDEATLSSLNYISPEQTGLLQRNIDNRSDLYSLGALFYELITGRPPFVEKDLSKLIYKHLAQCPEKPKNINSEIPDIINDIILKLLNKEPDERYQSAAGLINDIEKHIANPDKLFLIGSEDKTAKLNFKIKSVGREKELKTLNEQYQKIKSNNPKITFINGNPGFGKSKLVSTFTEKILNPSTKLISYKCSKASSNIPLAPIFRIVNEYFDKIYKQEYFNEILIKNKNNIPVLNKLFPSFKKYFLGHGLNTNHIEYEKIELYKCISILLNTIGSFDENLILFIDDIHWADNDTLELVKHLSYNLKNTKILLISTFRKNDSINEYLKELQEKSKIFKLINLKPFNKKILPKFINRLLGQDVNFKKEFYDRIYTKTLGNPFFITESIKAIYDNELLWINNNKWEIDYEKLNDFTFESDISNTLLNRLSTLNKAQKEVLSIASVIGKHFNLELLMEIVHLKDPSNKLNTIIEIIDFCKKEQLIEEQLSKGKGIYSFYHDKIQETLYNELNEEKKCKLNLLCAKTLEKKYKKTIYNRIFSIAYYYNHTSDEKKRLKYNDLAYKKALSHYSLNHAVFYLKKIIDYHFNNNSIHKSTIALIYQLSDILQITGNIEESFTYLEKALDKIKKEKWKNEEIQINIKIGKGYYYLNETNKSLAYYIEAIHISEQENIEIKSAYPYMAFGSSNWFAGEIRKAKEYFTKAISYLSDKEYYNYVSTYGIRSWSNLHMGNCSMAIKDVNILEDKLNKIEDPLTLTIAYHTSAYTYAVSKKDPKKALDYSIKSYEYAAKSNNVVFMYSSLYSRANAYIQLKEYNKAIEACKNAIEISKEKKIYIGIDLFYGCIADAYTLNGNFDKANDVALEHIYRKNDFKIRFIYLQLLKARASYLYKINDLTNCMTILNEAYTFYNNYPDFKIHSLPLLYFRSYILKKIGFLKESDNAYDEVSDILGKFPEIKIYMDDTYDLIALIENEQSKELHTVSDTVRDLIHFKNVIKTSQIVSSILDTEEVMQAIMEKALEVTGAERGALLIFKENNCEIEYKVLKNIFDNNFTIPDDIYNNITQNKNGIVFSSNNESTSTSINNYTKSNNIKSLLTTPLISKGHINGLLYLDSKLISDLFSEDDLEILEVFTAQASIALDNARAYDALENTKTELEKAYNNEQDAKEEMEFAYEQAKASNIELQTSQIELEETNEKLNNALEKAEAASKVKSEFLAIMSHELRTPLSSMLGYSQLLLKEKNLNERQIKYAKVINTTGGKLLKILSDLLELSVLESGGKHVKYSSFDINRLIDDVFLLLKDEFDKKDITFKKPINPIDIIYSDEMKIRQLVFNLLGNAIKFTEHGNISLNLSIKNNEYIFEIRDTGIGIKEEHVKNIFDMFNQVENPYKRKYGGTGLGLAICKKLLDAINGKIWVTSKFETGSSFFFSIPIIEENELETNKPNLDKSLLCKNKLKILFAESDTTNFLLLEELIKDIKHSSSTGYNSIISVINELKQNNSYDLIILDFQLMKFYGEDCLKDIRNINKKIPIIGLRDRFDYNFQYCEDEINYLEKPLNIAKFKENLKTYL